MVDIIYVNIFVEKRAPSTGFSNVRLKFHNVRYWLQLRCNQCRIIGQSFCSSLRFIVILIIGSLSVFSMKMNETKGHELEKELYVEKLKLRVYVIINLNSNDRLFKIATVIFAVRCSM